MATATIEASQSLTQSEHHSYSETSHVTEHKIKKKKSSRRHKDEGTVSVSKSSEKLYKKMKASNDGEANPQCGKCSRPVYIMERVRAEKRVWHKECFRCVQCSKQLTVETYQSDHTTLYCKFHFKQLFEPKPVEGDEDRTDAPPKKHQMIICESSPVELPPDVVRASDKPDLGLEELSQLDVKSRFQVFEQKAQQKDEQPIADHHHTKREKSAALLSKLAKFKAKGMDVGVSDEYLDGVPVEDSSSEPGEEEEDEDSVLKKSYKHTTGREQPVPFSNMNEIVGRFEAGRDPLAERHRHRKQEIQNIRSRLFMGKQAKIKEMYEQSVMQSEQSVTSADKISRELDLDSERARAIKQRFESGEVYQDENQPPKARDIDDTSLFDEGIGKKSRSIFLELDANAKNFGPTSPSPQEPPKRKEIPFVPAPVARSSSPPPPVAVDTAHIGERFRFFETYRPPVQRKEFRMTPPPANEEVERPATPPTPPPVVTSPAAEAHTASRMIDVFRKMEDRQHERGDTGPKPLKCFTPPPPGAYTRDSSSEADSTDDDDDDDDSETERRRAYFEARQRDEALQQAQELARTKSFRSKFENWADNEPTAARNGVRLTEHNQDDDDGESQLETAKSLREKFENMKVQQSSVTKAFAPKVNRFV